MPLHQIAVKSKGKSAAIDRPDKRLQTTRVVCAGGGIPNVADGKVSLARLLSIRSVQRFDQPGHFACPLLLQMRSFGELSKVHTGSLRAAIFDKMGEQQGA